MNKEKFVDSLKESLLFHYDSIKEMDTLISFGIYSDDDASTLSIYYNTRRYLIAKIDNDEGNFISEEEKINYYTFFMEEWKNDISYKLKDDKLDILNDLICQYSNSEYENGNKEYKDEIFDMFAESLHELKTKGTFENENDEFFLHIEVSDSWIDKKMLNRVSKLMSYKRFEEYKKYSEKDK